MFLKMRKITYFCAAVSKSKKPMQIHLTQAYKIHEIGKRQNNEDSLFPQHPTENDRLFIVCDGVGGNAGGEIASEITCRLIAAYFKQYVRDVASETHLQEAIGLAQESLYDAIKTMPENSKAATTLALLHLNSRGALLAHIGDSRIYHFRNGEILYKTHDHSLVNEMVALGILAPEQAASHSQSNVITRCIMAQNNVAADVTYRTDILPNDVFLVCSDGIIEGCDDQKMADYFKNNTLETAMNLIAAECAEYSRDNYTAIGVQVRNPTILVG